MRKSALFVFCLALSAGASAADLCGMKAADVSAGFLGQLPAPVFAVARTYPARTGLEVCEASIAKMINFRDVSFRDGSGRQLRGFESAYYTERGPMAVSLVMQTAGSAYFYYEDCDICAEIDRCDIKTGEIRRLVAAHSAGCGDLPKNPAGLVYNSCAGGNSAQTCSAVGEDVRIPEECCSKNAEPNQNGEMTCVAAPHIEPACSAVGEDVRIPEECCSKKAEPNQNGEMTCVAARLTFR